ncbi:MAG: hypothetical protein FWC43_08375, partial [Planctomycetaceae bacterium]|nr:hypothetical protein [Planctomycetaceae bacterium]
IWVGGNPGCGWSSELCAVGNTLFFSAQAVEGNYELWKSDGTAAGTVLVKEIRSGNIGSYPAQMTAVGNTLYFTAADDTTGTELWKSDGTAGGTVLVKDIRPGSSSSTPANFVVLNNTLYFSADNGTNGFELWKSDGTAGGTTMVKDICPGAGSSNPSELTVMGGYVYFAANNGTDNIELWRTDGTANGTVMVKEIRSGTTGSNPKNLTVLGNTLYFSANDGISGVELWKSDGTANGTVLVKDIRPGPGDSSPYHLTPYKGKLIFAATDDHDPLQLFLSDGSGNGTNRVIPYKILPVAVIANATNLAVRKGCSLLLSAAPSLDPSGKGLTYLWDLLGNGNYVAYTGATVWFSAETFNGKTGTKQTIRLKVRDAEGNLSEAASAEITILNVAPTYYVNHGDLVAGQFTRWEFSAADIPGSAVMKWVINWGDGTETVVNGGPRNHISETHRYRESKNYTITIRTTDLNGIESTATLGIHVAAKTQAAPPWDDALTWDSPEAGLWDDGDTIIAGAPYGADNRNTSEYMIGNVYVTLVLMESSGSRDPNVTNWSTTQRNDVIREVSTALNWWEEMFVKYNPDSQIKLTFTLDVTWAENPFSTSYEPINRPHTDESLWIGEFLTAQGYSGSYSTAQSHLTDLRDFNHKQRETYHTDWAFSIFVVNSRDTSNNKINNGYFTDNWFAYGWVGGPSFVMTYDNDNWGIDGMALVAAHEVGHIFYALDEYPSSSAWSERRGYYNIQNTNAYDGNPTPSTRVSSIMAEATLQRPAFSNLTSSPASLQMVGWRDSDGDGILDVLDVPLILTSMSTNASYDSTTNQFDFKGTSSVTTLTNQNSSSSPKRDITLNTVDKLQYKLDGGVWMTLDTAYGGTTNVNVSAQLDGFAPGSHTLLFRTICERTGVTSGELTFAFTTVATATLDITGTGNFGAADVNLLLRYLFKYSGTNLTHLLTTQSPEEIVAYIEENFMLFDIDGDGEVNAIDANLLLRYLYNYDGDDLTHLLVTSSSTRKTATEIVAYIESVLPEETAKATCLRQMLDLDQSQNFGQKSNEVADVIFADDELFADEWFDFAGKRSDFWDNVFEDDLLAELQS